MWTNSETVPLTSNVFAILRDVIHEKTGLDYDLDKADLLAEKLSHRVIERGLGSFLDYYYLLKYGPDADTEWPHLMDALSVQETYFWRELSQIEAFVSVILPDYIARHPHSPVEIWCAACATGEEPFTIAMALSEAGWFLRRPIRITASDASPAAIEKARRGLYRERSFRALPPTLQAKYFLETRSGWQIQPELASRVEFHGANLTLYDTVDRFGRVPFIFCRNVFIYFSDQAIRQAVQNFARCMPRPGYLFVGASESLLRLTTDFELEAAGDAFVYSLKQQRDP